MTTVEKPFYTFEQYLEIERAREYRSEYFAGEIFAMASGTENHSLVIVNVASIWEANSKTGRAKSTPVTCG